MMIKSKLLAFLLTLFISKAALAREPLKDVVSSTFQIILNEYPTGWNSSIIEVKEGFLLSFRYLPEPVAKPWISYVGVALLDHSFKQISQAELLDLRQDNIFVASQAEDARVFRYKDELYVIYNDNTMVLNTRATDRRDMYIAKLSYSFDGMRTYFCAEKPLKLVHPVMYSKRMWEKNWVPFVWEDKLLLAYSINPHEVLEVDLTSGICSPIYSTPFSKDWIWGTLRGGTPAERLDDDYFAFFHSGKPFVSEASHDKLAWHYFMGAYTFSKEPPFRITRISPIPINDPSFYTKSDREKRVIYPGGYIVSGDDIYVTYGKDDAEIWIAIINKEKLFRTLQPVEYENID